MKKNMLDDDFMDNEIEEFLASYVVKECDKEHIDETINVLKGYMPRNKEKHSLLKMIRNELTYVSKGYLLASLILIIVGIFVTANMKIKSYDIMLIVSPIPAIIGIYEVTKSRSGNMWELEKSMKYSYSLISLAKILIVIGISSILNMAFSILLCSRNAEINFLYCTASWIVPMSIVFSVSLFIFHMISKKYIALCILSIWIGAVITFNKYIIRFLESLSNSILVLVMLVSMFTFIVSIYRFYEKEKSYEGEIVWN